MKVLVIEDEKLAAERLTELIEKFNPEYKVIGRVDSVETAIQWFNRNLSPDLVFMDIHLADGNAFEIFEAISLKSPIIFCTAFDQYAIKAFKVNSVDYLLKPVEQEDLFNALIKFEKQQLSHNMSVNIEELVKSFTKPYKTRFVTKMGEHLHAIEVDQIHFFYSEEKVTYLQHLEGKRFIIDFPLDKVEDMVDPQKFFRISRKYIISFEAVKDILSHTNSRLRLVLQNSNDNDVIVSRERVQQFKSWLDR